MSVSGFGGRITECPTCKGHGEVATCARLSCNRPTIGRCLMCDYDVCAEHRLSVMGAPLCRDCQPEATMERIHKARARA